MKYYILLIFIWGMVFLTGCSGFSRLPDINFIGKSREEVIKVFAEHPEKSHDGQINLMIPVSRHAPLDCNGNLYFKTVEDALADERIQKAPAIGGCRTERCLAIPGGWDYYEVVFDKNNIAVSQKMSSYFDGP